MIATLLPLSALIGLGLLWVWWRPGPDGDGGRRPVTDIIYHLFLPALVLDVLWRAPLGLDSARISASAVTGVLFGLGLSVLVYRVLRVDRPTTGALVLAAGFPNATYLGLPVLERVLGETGRGIAIQYDVFACTPMLFTVGVLVATHFGPEATGESVLRRLARVPPLWAALAAIALNLSGVPLPGAVDGFLRLLGTAMVPIMLLAVGMALRAGFSEWRRFALVLPVLLIQLLLMPLLVWSIAHALGLRGELLTGTVLEAAMPTMALGVVFCDRYRLNAGLFATAMTLSTLLCLATLPLWFGWLGS